jgi:hypothetical protein
MELETITLDELEVIEEAVAPGGAGCVNNWCG